MIYADRFTESDVEKVSFDVNFKDKTVFSLICRANTEACQNVQSMNDDK